MEKRRRDYVACVYVTVSASVSETWKSLSLVSVGQCYLQETKGTLVESFRRSRIRLTRKAIPLRLHQAE